MGMQINTNIGALNAYRNLSNTQNDLSKSLEKLSSGLRINRAADDAAGLAISEGLRSQIGGLTVAARNAQDGISVIQTVEGALTETHSILQRMRDLAVQAGNDSNSPEAREAIATEAGSLRSELSRIAGSTNFNGIQLLNSTDTLSFQVGADGDANSQIQVGLTNANVASIADALSSDNVTAFAVANAAAVGGDWDFTSVKDGVTSSLTVDMGTAGDHESVEDVAAYLNANASFASAYSAQVDGDGALAIRAHNGGTVDTTALGAGTVAGNATAADLSFTTAAGAQAAINLIDTQITAVSTARAELGAVQNRFESAINTLNVSKENITAAESRIRDTDMAEEMVNFTRANLLSQAGTAMLAQANQSNSGVLALLR